MKISIFQVAYKNLLRKKTRSVLTVLGIALAAWVLVSLFGFNKGYETSLNRDIDNLGFQMLVIAKGCPYEAATLMLKGGTGLKYLKQEIADRIAREPEVDGVTPMLMQVVFDPNKGESGGLAVYQGVDPKTFPRMKSFLKFKQGGWFTDPAARRGRHRLRGGRARTARGRRHVPHPGEERRGQGRRRPGADGDPGRRDASSSRSAPSRRSSGSRTSSPASGSRSRRTPTSRSSRRGCTSSPTSRSSA